MPHPATPSRARRAAGSGEAAQAVDLANRLRPVLLQLSRQLRRETHSLGVSASQVSLLGAVATHPGIGVAELAAHERVAAASVSTAVARLAEAGLLARTRPHDCGDRRRVGLTLSAQGEEVLRTVRSHRTAWLAARLESLSDDDLAAVDAAVEPLARLLEGRR